jgi:drug/metabolite transporter (DMT)-like permease
MIPAFAEFITSTLHYTALNFIPGSVYQMMRGSTVVTTMIFSILFLDKKLRRHQVTGCIIVIMGILIVAISNLVIAKYHTEYEVDVVN